MSIGDCPKWPECGHKVMGQCTEGEEMTRCEHGWGDGVACPACDAFASLYAEIADLRRKLEDARKDAERLDWMEANPESPSVPYFDITNHWLIPFLSNGAGGFGGGVGYRSYTTLRAAIDAAMKEQS